ncbi:glycosyltransferase [Candidatus Pelagibacter sp.]|nr:glycosyltransferase [Candidatus Pelagibacter sp.]
MTKHNHSLTVITVVKNDQKNIEKTIKSVVSNNKGFKFEYIVIDGKSKDKTLSIVKKYRKKISKIISEKDKGIYDAMNKGIKKSKNDIIVFCNSGDFFYKNSLKKIIQIFNTKNVDYVFGTVVRNYTKKKIIKFSLNPRRIYYNFDFATAHSTGFFLKRNIYKKIGLYDLKFKCSSDFDLYFRIINKGYVGSVTKKKDLIGNVASGGFSSKIPFFEHLIEESKIRIKNKQNIFFISIIFLNSIIKNLVKNLF